MSKVRLLLVDIDCLSMKQLPTGEILLSPIALSIQKQISGSIQTRRHVSYNREFLDQYRPNESYYLPMNVRQHLLKVGKSPIGDRPAGTYARQIYSRLLIDLSWNSAVWKVTLIPYLRQSDYLLWEKWPRAKISKKLK